MDSFDILVIILSVFLGIFLSVGIIFTIMLVKLVNQLRKITAKAEAVMEEVEHVGEFFRKSAPPVALFKLMSNVVSTFMKHKK